MLNARQAAFVREYLVDGNAMQAAIRAGYSRKTAGAQGSRLLIHAEVAAAIQAGQAHLAHKTEISLEAVLKRLWREANAGDLSEPNAVRVNALRTVGKHLGLREKVELEHSGHESMVDLVKRIQATDTETEGGA